MWRFAAVAVMAVIVGLQAPGGARASGPSGGWAPAAPGERCATAKVKRPKRPKPPPTPSHDPMWRTIGGKRLAADGRVLDRDATKLPKGLTARSWLVADLNTGEVIGGCGPHVYGAPASTQKLLLAVALLDKLDPDQKVRVTRDDLQYEPGSSAVGLVRRGEYSVDTLWLGLLMNSGNDAAKVLARVGGGAEGIPGTIREMNAVAKRLGAYQTHAVTPSGLDGKRQLTSAYDLALIARTCFARADCTRYLATERAKIPAQPPKYKGFEIQNDNQLLYEYRGAIGGKTGFTDRARHTYVGAAEREGRRLVVTLLGAEREPRPAWKQGAALLDWGFRQPTGTAVGRLVEPGELSRSPSPSPRGGGSKQAGEGTEPAGPRWWLVVGALLGAAIVAGIGWWVMRRRRRRRLALVLQPPPRSYPPPRRPRGRRPG